MITYGSVCSGIEAATTAWHPLGWSPRWFAEIEPFPSAVLAHHWPDVPNLGDFTAIRDKIAEGAVEAPDVLVGGTPCQAFSVAGLRQSLDDKRGQLTLEFVRLANAIDSARSLRGKRPVTVVWENVFGILNTKDNAFGCFLGALAGEDVALVPAGKKWTNAGVVYGPKRTVAWRILDAQYFGVAQRRRRVFVVASARAWFDPAAVLFEFDGVRQDSPPRRESGKGSSADAGRSPAQRSHWDGGPHPSLSHSTNIAGGVGMSNQAIFSQRGAYLVPHPVAFAIQERTAHPNLNAGPGGKGFQEGVAYTPEARHHVQAVAATGDVFHTPRGEGFDASEDGTGRGAGAVAVGFNARQDPDSWEGRTGPLDTDGGTQAVVVNSQSLYIKGIKEENDACAQKADTGKVLRELREEAGEKASSEWGSGIPHSLQRQEVLQPPLHGKSIRQPSCKKEPILDDGALPCPENLSSGAMLSLRQDWPDRRAPQGRGLVQQHPRQPGSALSLVSSERASENRMMVRRLTPTEAERLQGFPDGQTLIPWRGKSAEECPDGPRYKALGNSMAVPVMRWIGRRIDAALRECQP